MLSLIGRITSLACLALIVLGGLMLAGSGFMVMLPALFLVAPLLLGRYIGERRIERLRRALVARRLRPVGRALSRELRAGHASIFRGGRLIAASIAVRPPPVAA